MEVSKDSTKKTLVVVQDTKDYIDRVGGLRQDIDRDYKGQWKECININRLRYVNKLYKH